MTEAKKHHISEDGESGGQQLTILLFCSGGHPLRESLGLYEIPWLRGGLPPQGRDTQIP